MSVVEITEMNVSKVVVSDIACPNRCPLCRSVVPANGAYLDLVQKYGAWFKCLHCPWCGEILAERPL